MKRKTRTITPQEYKPFLNTALKSKLEENPDSTNYSEHEKKLIANAITKARIRQILPALTIQDIQNSFHELHHLIHNAHKEHQSTWSKFKTLFIK